MNSIISRRFLSFRFTSPPRGVASSTTSTSLTTSEERPFLPGEIIKMKRDGKTLSTKEINWLVSEYHAGKGSFLDYQMGALLMAICTRGMNDREALDLTKAFIHTGSQCVLSQVLSKMSNEKKKIIDKHSTGGVGDTSSLIVAPLAASVGLIVPMICSRGLGHTGGTIDKLESIPNIVTHLSMDSFCAQLVGTGCAIVSPHQMVSPVEDKIYSLRDTSGTVEAPALIASSILSKKLANCPDGLLLDVKMGRGALMTKLGDANALARMMVGIAEP
jgi:pyrimidine-nucleoside phosphorylase